MAVQRMKVVRRRREEVEGERRGGQGEEEGHRVEEVK